MKLILLSLWSFLLFGCFEQEEEKQDQTQDAEVKAFAENTRRLLKEIDNQEKKKILFLTKVADEAPENGNKRFSLLQFLTKPVN